MPGLRLRAAASSPPRHSGTDIREESAGSELSADDRDSGKEEDQTAGAEGDDQTPALERSSLPTGVRSLPLRPTPSARRPLPPARGGVRLLNPPVHEYFSDPLPVAEQERGRAGEPQAPREEQQHLDRRHASMMPDPLDLVVLCIGHVPAAAEGQNGARGQA